MELLGERPMPTCPRCGAKVESAIGFHAVCDACHAYLHCCVNCRLYSPHAHNHCLSSTTEYVRDVEAGNFCEEFDPAVAARKSGDVSSAVDKFKKLFGE
jgi:hypothetical protein